MRCAIIHQERNSTFAMFSSAFPQAKEAVPDKEHFQRLTEHLRSVLKKKWRRSEDYQRPGLFQKISVEKWNRMSKAERSRHSTGHCAACTQRYSAWQDVMPDRSQQMKAPHTAIRSKTASPRSAAGETVAQAQADITACKLNTNWQCRFWQYQRQVTRNVVRRLTSQWQERDVEVVLGHRVSAVKWGAITLKQSFESAEDKRRCYAQRPQLARSHVSRQPDRHWNTEAILAAAWAWPNGPCEAGLSGSTACKGETLARSQAVFAW